jgi:hypothetical protein
VGQVVQQPRLQCERCTLCIPDDVVRISIRFSVVTKKSTSMSGESDCVSPLLVNSRLTEFINIVLIGVRAPLSRSVPSGCMKLNVWKFDKFAPGAALTVIVGPDEVQPTSISASALAMNRNLSIWMSPYFFM